MASADGQGDICIDGSILEGGGQILRNSVALSAILTKPVQICKIRGGRTEPGLKPQHLTGLQLVNAMCGGQGLTGAEKGSTTITFHPGQIKGGRYIGDTRTAGSVCLMAQVAVPVALFAEQPSHLVLRGGTDVEWAPTVDFLMEVFIPFAKKFGIEMDMTLVRRGFFPKGGGEVEIEVQPLHHLKPVEFKACGSILRVTGHLYFANHHPTTATAMRGATVAALRRYLPADIDINIAILEEHVPQRTRAYGITLLAETESGCRLGSTSFSKKGSTPESVGEEAAKELISQHRYGGAVVEYLSDQLIIFMALAAGTSTIRTGSLTLHTKTAMHICKELLGVNFDVTPVCDPVTNLVSHEISCKGIGFVNNRMHC